MRHASKDLLCLERKDLPSSSLGNFIVDVLRFSIY